MLLKIKLVQLTINLSLPSQAIIKLYLLLQYCYLSAHHWNFSPNGNTTQYHLFVVVIFFILLIKYAASAKQRFFQKQLENLKTVA